MSLPMIGQMGSFSRPSADLGDPLDLYLHGYVSSRVMNVTRQQGSDEGNKGLPVSVCASHCDGVVLALSAFNHSYNYRSAVLFGHAQLVEDPDERLYAMGLITDAVVPDRFRHTRLPLTGAELQSTSILRVRIDNGSAKIRTGGVIEDKKDAENAELVEGTWTGVLPMYSSFGEPIPAEGNKVDVPAYISEFVNEYSKDNKEYSEKAVRM